MKNLLISGSIGYDTILTVPGRFGDRINPKLLDKISLSYLAGTMNKNFGGVACNIAYSSKLLGTDPIIFSSAGKDFGPYKEFLEKKNISTKYIAIDQHDYTGAYYVMTDSDQNQIGSFYTGALRISADLTIRSVFPKPDFVIVSPTYPPTMKKVARECKALGIPYMYDPSFQIGNFSVKELKEGIFGANFLIGNDYEISLILSRLSISRTELLKLVPVLITTLGSKGSIIETDKNESWHIPPCIVKKVVDPTGAGDAYRAGFLAGYLRGYDLPTCGRMGSVVSAYAVEKKGTINHLFTKKQFVKRYWENYREAISL